MDEPSDSKTTAEPGHSPEGTARHTALEARRDWAAAMGGEQRLERVRAAGKLSVRERLEHLLDPGSFQEIGALTHSQLPELRDRTPADGTVTGSGTIEGRTVFVSADDPTVLAGTRGRIAEFKRERVAELAIAEKRPFICLSEAGAARLQETRGAISAGLGVGFEQHIRMSGHIPQVSVMLGPAFGGPSFVSAQGDFTSVASGTGYIGMSGPPVVKVGLGVDLSAEEIGGATMAKETGQAHIVAADERGALIAARQFLSYLPSHAGERPPAAAYRPAPGAAEPGLSKLAQLVPDNHRQAYDARVLIRLLADEDSVFILHPDYGKNLVTAFARFDGQAVGVIANNPMFRAGVLDEAAATKARKFIDTCDAFHVPLLFLCDCPGFLVGPAIEKQRMVTLCARLMNSVISATVPKITVVTRKAVGMAYLAMCGRICRPSSLVAWPGAFFDVMGPEAGVMIEHGKAIAAADDPDTHKAELLAAYEAQASALTAAGMGLIDDVITPLETRAHITQTLARVPNDEPVGFKRRIEP